MFMPKPLVDLVGKKFGRLKVLAFAETKKINGKTKRQCDCGKTVEVLGVNLTKASKPTRSCGCLRSKTRVAINSQPKDLVGKRFGRLTVVRFLGSKTSNRTNKTSHWWLCECDCGATKELKTAYLTRNDRPTRSCGCIQSECVIKANTIHGGTSKFLEYGKYLYNLWRNIKQKCYDANSISYKNYGGRGINMYREWIDDYPTFEKWVVENLGHRLEGYSLDRINNNGNYEPGNLRWVDRSAQENNSRKTRKMVAQFTKTGEYLTTHNSLSDAARAIGKEPKCSYQISLAAKGKSKSAFGYNWKFV
jgi:hypothetical protein